MKKKDLKPGCEVVQRDGKIGTVILGYTGNQYCSGDIIRFTDGQYCDMENVNDDLTGTESRFDIMEVYSTTPGGRRCNLLWERKPDVLEKTMADLEEDYGKKVKIVKEKSELAIGEVGYIMGVKVKCIEDNGGIDICKNCVFDCLEECADTKCNVEDRSDGKDVHYVGV